MSARSSGRSLLALGLALGLGLPAVVAAAASCFGGGLAPTRMAANALTTRTAATATAAPMARGRDLQNGRLCRAAW